MEKKIRDLRKNLYDDDLLEQQSAFLKQSKDPSFEASVSTLYKSEQVTKKQESRNDQATTNVFMPLEIVEHDTRNVSVMDIERSIGETVKMNDKMKVDLTSFKNTSSDKKKSLFSQYMENKRQKSTQNASSQSVSIDVSSIRLIDGSSLCVDSERAKSEIESISRENDEKLSRLSNEEKRQLLQEYVDMSGKQRLDLNLIKIIKQRKVNKSEPTSDKRAKKDFVTFNLPTTVNENSIDKPSKQEIAHDQIKSPYIDEEEIRRNKWLNMDKIESEKFEWMKPLIENEAKRQVNTCGPMEGRAARFNFEGDLIVEEETDYRKGLHHHSEQDTASGYTVNELIAFTQSKYIPQRILALNTLANIFRRMHRGYFDICFDKSLTIELIEHTELLILLRTLLDDSNVSTQLVTIKCIHSLVCNTIYDEFAFDRLFCSIELGIEVPNLCYVEVADESDLKDEQLCKLDAISCLIRMNILSRLRYLLDSLVLKRCEDPMVIDNIMDILIRICRHSSKSCDHLIETPFLLECLVENFITCTSDVLNWKALKVIRILFTTNKVNIIKIKKKFPNLWTALGNYLVMNPPDRDDKEFYAGIIEVMRMYRVLLILDNESNETIDQFKSELASNIKCCLDMRILTNNSFDLHYVSNLLHCLAYVIQKLPLQLRIYFEGFFTPLVQDLTFRWFKEIVDYSELPKLDGCLALSSALLYLSWSYTTKEQLLQNIFKPFLNSSNLIEKLTNQLLANSSILNFKEYHNSVYRDSKALPSYGSIYFGGSTIRLNTLLSEQSIIFLVGPLIGLAAKHQMKDCFEKFIYNANIKVYLDRIVKQTNKSSNWTIFELIEFNPISQLILWERKVLYKNEYFDHALAILSSVGDLQLKHSLNEYIFDVKEYISIYDRMKENQLVKSSICFFNEIKKVYSKFSTFEGRNWVFEPLMKLHKLDEADQLSENELVEYVTSWLNYVILLYNLKPGYLWSLIEPKILFVYLSSVFLFKNALFLNGELVKILEYFLVNLTNHHKINFDCYEEKVPEPYNSIGDHFNALCVNYRTDSYGNHVFSNYLLSFLTQSCDKIFRKKLLDEHGACLTYFVLKKEELLIKLETLINPIDDLTIVESYVRILMAKDIVKQRNPLIYEIACTHVSRALFGENRSKKGELVNKLITCLKQSNNKQLQQDLGIV